MLVFNFFIFMHPEVLLAWCFPQAGWNTQECSCRVLPTGRVEHLDLLMLCLLVCLVSLFESTQGSSFLEHLSIIPAL